MLQLTCSLISLLLFAVYGTDYTGCVTTGKGADNVTLDSRTSDKIISSDGNVRFVIDSSTAIRGDVCLETIENTQATPRWCLLWIGVVVTNGGKFVIGWNGDLTYIDNTNTQIWSSNTKTLTDMSPLSLCVTDCGRVTLIRDDNKEEIWRNPDYVRDSPTTYPTCSPPSIAPTAVSGTNYTGCVTTGKGTGNVILDSLTKDKIISSDGNVRFTIGAFIGDVCLETIENNQATPRWCLLFLGVPVTNVGKFVIGWNGDLTYIDNTNTQIWSSNTKTLTDVSPLSLCVTDCGRVTLIREDNKEEIWNPDYVIPFPTTYPTCPPPSIALL